MPISLNIIIDYSYKNKQWRILPKIIHAFIISTG